MRISTQTVQLRDVEIRLRRRIVVAPFTWSGKPGGVAWLTGENGTGKSSLMRVLAGFQAPTRGEVRWTGVDGATARYHTPSMFAAADVKVRDWIDFVETIDARVETDALAADLFPRTSEPHRRFGQLSTGEAKRLFLWAILRAPDLPLLLDEPYEHLSRDAKTVLTRLLRERAQNSIVIVATNQDVPLIAGEQLLTLDGTDIGVEAAPC